MADRRRMERVNGLLREEISGLLASQVNDPRLQGIITITQVRTASDLRSARVYVSVMGTEASAGEALAGIPVLSIILAAGVAGSRHLAPRAVPHLSAGRCHA